MMKNAEIGQKTQNPREERGIHAKEAKFM